LILPQNNGGGGVHHIAPPTPYKQEIVDLFFYKYRQTHRRFFLGTLSSNPSIQTRKSATIASYYIPYKSQLNHGNLSDLGPTSHTTSPVAIKGAPVIKDSQVIISNQERFTMYVATINFYIKLKGRGL
jgi:hypothetical protein